MAEAETAPAWAFEPASEVHRDWQSIDRALRTIALRRGELDATEARWLREAEAYQIWRPLGMVSALDYMERALGYKPRAAQDRLRVARALGALPQLTEALAEGELPFSAIRELTRVVTPQTEAAWRKAATGKNVRQIEELVAGHRPGDHPDDPADPEVRTHVVRFEVSAETFALLRQTRTVLDGEHGSHMSDDQLVAALCGAVLEGTSATESRGRAKFQIAVTVCERCRQGWQDGAGAKVAISSAAVERAMCDAQHIGSIDGDVPERAYQDIPPSVARLVWRRDGGRCRVPGCRSARGIEIHHLIRRVDGGSHGASNLVLLCSSCHLAHHNGMLTISGTADHLEVQRPGNPGSSAKASAHVGAPIMYNTTALRTQGKVVIRRTIEPNSAVEAGAHVGVPTKLDMVIARTQSKDAARRLTEPSAGAKLGAHVGTSPKLDEMGMRAQAQEALIGLGWKSAIAKAAVAAASTALGTEPTLERMIFEALRRCPRPVC